VEQSLLSAIAMFGVAVDVTVAELHIEPFFPADAAAALAGGVDRDAGGRRRGLRDAPVSCVCVRRAVGGGWAHDHTTLGEAVVRH
jgi:hypothetical protein